MVKKGIPLYSEKKNDLSRQKHNAKRREKTHQKNPTPPKHQTNHPNGCFREQTTRRLSGLKTKGEREKPAEESGRKTSKKFAVSGEGKCDKGWFYGKKNGSERRIFVGKKGEKYDKPESLGYLPTRPPKKKASHIRGGEKRDCSFKTNQGNKKKKGKLLGRKGTEGTKELKREKKESTEGLEAMDHKKGQQM